MPFDTTFNVNTFDPNLNGTLVIRGGKDTAINLAPWQLPSALDSSLAKHDITILDFQNTLAKQANHKEPYMPDPGTIIMFLIVFSFIIFSFWRKSKEPPTYSEAIFNRDDEPRVRPFLTYYGSELQFSDQQLDDVLVKRFTYYNSLSTVQQAEFIKRLQKFIADKIFRIHDEKGFKEMPILVSAAAIQLSFGLKKYLLPHFHYIHIHPEEFLRIRPILCFLEGNVSGHSINLSWKHFIQGYENPHDGQNVGLHELAHALHYQNFVVERNVDKGFRHLFDSFHVDGNKAFQTEKTVAGGLYSEYAEKNFQEFWAESIELFFEKPREMKTHYPGLYSTMKVLLNQDPLKHLPSLGR